MAESKVFNDPIHGHIELHPLCIRIIDTPQFQRLRYIKQLGASYFVFPGASHNRFEHSLGVGHLAGELVRQLRLRQNDELPEHSKITDEDVLCVEIAGLCHDLGHGPFSHMFDAKFIPRTGNPNWQHEDASLAMFDELVRENNLKEEFLRYCLTDTDLTFIKEQIGGPLDSNSQHAWPYKGRGEDKGFLYEVVANKRNGIDVDKWDYFARDCHHLGIRSNFDHLRFMKFARIIRVDGRLQICSRDKEVGNVYDMFYTRNTLHRRAYQHKNCTIIEEMIVEALLMANDVLTFPGTNGAEVRLSDTIDDMKAYVQVTDWVYQQILHSRDPRLSEARALLERIEHRQLYKCIGQSRPTNKDRRLERIKDEEDIARCIAQCSDGSPQPLDSSSIVVQIVSYDYGKKEKNPVDQVRFYSKTNLTQAIEIRRNEVSHMLPDTFSEQYIRVYSKDRAADRVTLARDCFQTFCRDNDFMPPKGGDPGLWNTTPVKDSGVAKRPCSMYASSGRTDESPSPPQGKQRRL